MPPESIDSVQDRQALSQLRKLLTSHFNTSELQVMCFDIGVDYEELEGSNKTTKVQDLISYLYRRNELHLLIGEAKKQRPSVKWLAINLSEHKGLKEELLYKHNKATDQDPSDRVSQHFDKKTDLHSQPSISSEKVSDHTLKHLSRLSSKNTILTIEDAKHQQLAIKQVIESIGLGHEVANNLDEALTLIRSKSYVLITLDMQLDFIDSEGQIGLMLLDQIEQYQDDIPVVIISGLRWTGTDVRGFFVNYKVTDYFTKPFDPSNLKERILDIISAKPK